MQRKAMTTKEVAEFLNVSNQTVYNLIKAKEIPAFKIGNAVRILSADLDTYIDNLKVAHRAANATFRNEDPSLFSVQSLCAHYDNFPLMDINFEFPLGKTACFLGPSGCGKTLLLRSLAGFMHLDSGAVFNGHTRYDSLNTGERRLGYVFQDYALFPHLNSRQNIGFPLLVRHTEKKQLDEEVRKILASLKFPERYEHMKPEMLPEGVKQLVAIGTAQSNVLDCFIMDEPLAHLDAMVKKEMRIFLKTLVTDLGKTTIYAFNDPTDALVLADYVGIMDQGRLIQFGETEDVYAHPTSLVSLEAMSLNGTVHIPVEVKNGLTDPLAVGTDKSDGSYMLYFRHDDVELSEQGTIRGEVLQRKFFDGRKLTATCRLNESVTVDLLLDKEVDDRFAVNLKRPFFLCV